MKTVTTEVFTYSELSDSAKEAARLWWTEALEMRDYADHVLEDFEEIAGRLGVSLGDGKDSGIYWTGFWFQGDGASFVGRYRAKGGCLLAIKEWAPQDEVLHGIAAELDEVFRKSGGYAVFDITHTGRYYHEYSMDFEDLTDWLKDFSAEFILDIRAKVVETMRNLARWLYGQLKESYEYTTSEEVVAEALEEGEYTFTSQGVRFG
jgi:hypothetical protein